MRAYLNPTLLKNIAKSIPILGAGILIAAVSWNPLFRWLCFTRLSYYFVLLLFFTWVVIILGRFRFDQTFYRNFSRNVLPPLLISLAFSASIFLAVKPEFRVLDDEADLLAVSRSMTVEKRIDFPMMALGQPPHFIPLFYAQPKRPVLFPFLTHLLHVLFGFRSENAFIINFITLTALLTAILIWIRAKSGFLPALTGILLVAAQPVLVLSATSGGFDLLFAFLVLVCFFCLDQYLKEPSAKNLRFLWIHLLLLCHTRYEAPLFMAVTVMMLFLFKYVKKDFYKGSFLYAATPFFLLPILWNFLNIAFSTIDLFSLQGNVAFSLQNFLRNNLIFIKTHYSFGFYFPYASLINILGTIAVLIFLFQFFAKKNFQAPQQHLIIIAGINWMAYWIILTSYFDGNANAPYAARYFTLSSILLSLFAARLLNQIALLKWNIFCNPFIGICLCLYYSPIAAQNQWISLLDHPREYKIVLDFIRDQPYKNILLITHTPKYYVTQNHAAVTFGFINQEPMRQEILDALNSPNDTAVYAIQSILNASKEPNEWTKLNANFKLEMLREVDIHPSYFVRISRITDYKSTPP